MQQGTSPVGDRFRRKLQAFLELDLLAAKVVGTAAAVDSMRNIELEFLSTRVAAIAAAVESMRGLELDLLSTRIAGIAATIDSLRGLEPGPAAARVAETVPDRQTYAYLGDRRGLVVLHDGARMFVDTRDISLAPSLIAFGYWERWIETVVTRLVRPGAVAVDVGANFGYYTLAMARAAGPAGKVHAFEANPDVAGLLADTIAVNGLGDRVTSRNTAILDSKALVELSVDPRYLGGGHISVPTDERRLLRHRVDGMTLCDALPGVERIDVLRMDIEGAEPLALKGAEPLIRRSPDLVIVSEWAVPMMAARHDVAGLVDWLARLGFGFWRIGNDSTLERVSAGDMPSLPHCDVVMARHQPL